MLWFDMYDGTSAVSSILLLLLLFMALFLCLWQERGTDLETESSNSIILHCSCFSRLYTASSLSYIKAWDRNSFIRNSNHWHLHIKGLINLLQWAVTFFFLQLIGEVHKVRENLPLIICTGRGGEQDLSVSSLEVENYRDSWINCAQISIP